MELVDKVKEYIMQKAQYWYMAVTGFVFLEILNCEVLRRFVPYWVSTCVTVVLLLMMMGYAAVLYGYVRDKYRDYLENSRNILLGRVDILEQNINEMNSKNIELENRLAELIQKQNEENTEKLINDIDRTLKEGIHAIDQTSSETMEKLSGFEENFVNTSAQINSSLDRHGKLLMDKLLENQKEENALFKEQSFLLTEKMDSIETEFKEISERNAYAAQDQSETLLQQSLLLTKQLTEMIEEKASMLKAQSENLRDEMAEAYVQDSDNAKKQTTSILELIAETSAEKKALIEQTKETITEQLGDLIQEKSADMKTQTEHIEAMQLRTNEFIQECRGLISEQISERILSVLDKTEETSKEVKNQVIKEVTDHMSLVQSALLDSNEKNVSDLREQAASQIQLNTASAQMLKDLLEERTTGLADQNTELNAKISETHNQINQKLENYSTDIITKITERAEELSVTSSYEIRTGIEETSNKNHELVNDTANTVVARLTEIQNTIHEMEKDGKNRMDAQSSVFLRKLEEVSAAEPAFFREKTEEIFSRLASHSEQSEVLVKDQRARIDDLIKAQGAMFNMQLNGIDQKISSYQTENQTNSERMADKIGSIIKECSEHQDMLVYSQGKELQDSVSGIIQQIKAVRKEFEDRTDQLSVDTANLQQNITGLLVQVLDNVDENAEKTDKSYNYLFSQINNFSKNTKSQIEQLKAGLEHRTQEENQTHKTQLQAIYEDTLQTGRLNDTVISYSKLVENYQSGLNGKLNNLESQLNNLNSLAQMLKHAAEQRSDTPKDKDPNRVDEIYDKETGMTVFNHYKAGRLVLSEMRAGKKKMYEVEYDGAGHMARSRNYDSSGNLTTEMSYYSDGQVKERSEQILTDGKVKTVKTRFDSKGKKIN